MDAPLEGGVDLRMGDRRSGVDRRAVPRDGDRRQGDRRHGERATYKAGCSCTPCRAAEASYRAELRRREAEGRPALGARVGPGMMWRQIDALRREGYTDGEIARRLGLQTPRLQLHRERVTLRSKLKVQRLYRLTMAVDGSGAGEVRG
jgi:hypothetical protein